MAMVPSRVAPKSFWEHRPQSCDHLDIRCLYLLCTLACQCKVNSLGTIINTTSSTRLTAHCMTCHYIISVLDYWNCQWNLTIGSTKYVTCGHQILARVWLCDQHSSDGSLGTYIVQSLVWTGVLYSWWQSVCCHSQTHTYRREGFKLY